MDILPRLEEQFPHTMPPVLQNTQSAPGDIYRGSACAYLESSSPWASPGGFYAPDEEQPHEEQAMMDVLSALRQAEKGFRSLDSTQPAA
jgi:hypothetical protein